MSSKPVRSKKSYLRLLSLMIITGLVAGLSVSANAQDKAQNSGSADQAAAPAPVEIQEPEKNPYIEQVKEQAKALAQSLNEDQIRDLALLRSAFGKLESVSLVHAHVNDAVETCSQNYAETGASAKQQLSSWENRIMPLLNENKALLHNILNDGRFSDPNSIQTYLDTIDKAAEFSDARLVRDPVINEKTCKGLTKSLERTREELAVLLGEIEWPEGADKARAAKPKHESALETAKEETTKQDMVKEEAVKEEAVKEQGIKEMPPVAYPGETVTKPEAKTEKKIETLSEDELKKAISDYESQTKDQRRNGSDSTPVAPAE